MPSAVQLVLVRHGHTAANGGGRARLTMSGWTDTPLTGDGRREAAVLCARLSGEGPFDALYSSPLRRAVDTARCLEPAAGGTTRLEPDLREMRCGEVDGLPVDEVRARYPEIWARNDARDDDGFRWPGGESYAELRARAAAAADRIAARHPGGRVIVVTHTGVITQLLGTLAGTRPARWDLWRVGNASITVVEWTRRGGRIVSVDDRAHVAAAAAFAR